MDPDFRPQLRRERSNYFIDFFDFLGSGGFTVRFLFIKKIIEMGENVLGKKFKPLKGLKL